MTADDNTGFGYMTLADAAEIEADFHRTRPPQRPKYGTFLQQDALVKLWNARRCVVRHAVRLRREQLQREEAGRWVRNRRGRGPWRWRPAARTCRIEQQQPPMSFQEWRTTRRLLTDFLRRRRRYARRSAPRSVALVALTTGLAATLAPDRRSGRALGGRRYARRCAGSAGRSPRWIRRKIGPSKPRHHGEPGPLIKSLL
jgi:hypothetical protein